MSIAMARRCACLIAFFHGGACAAPADWVAVDSATLDRQRGGFTTAAGLEVALGIERMVTINGTVVAQTSFQVADVSRLSPEQAEQTRATLSSIKLIQTGSDNMVHAALPSGLGGTIIQNSLNDQRIQTHTIVNASANSLGLLTTLNFQGSLGEAIARSAGAR